MATTPVLLPGILHGQRRLAGYSPWGCKESHTTEHTHPHSHPHTHTDTQIHTDRHTHTQTHGHTQTQTHTDTHTQIQTHMTVIGRRAFLSFPVCKVDMMIQVAVKIQ